MEDCENTKALQAEMAKACSKTMWVFRHHDGSDVGPNRRSGVGCYPHTANTVRPALQADQNHNNAKVVRRYFSCCYRKQSCGLRRLRHNRTPNRAAGRLGIQRAISEAFALAARAMISYSTGRVWQRSGMSIRCEATRGARKAPGPC